MPKQALIRFAEIAKGFDDTERLKLVLFASGVKHATYVVLKIDTDNLTEKFHFEERLNALGVVFVESRMRAYEEIDRIAGNKVYWKIKGVWIGYDLFRGRKELGLFREYVSGLQKQRRRNADRIAGRLYGYPVCCIKEYIRQQDPDYIKDNFSYYEYYRQLQDCERKFPFIAHTPCSASCKNAAKLNARYRSAVRKYSPNFYRKFSSRKVYSADLIVDAPSDMLKDGKSIWPVKSAFEYSVISMKPYEKHYYIYTYLSRKFYDQGAVLGAKVAMQYRYADIRINKVKREIKNLMHIRKFFVVGRSF